MQKKVVHIAAEKLESGKYDIRADVNDDGIAALAASIGRVGVLVPLLVSSEGDKFIVVAGHRRLCAARMAGLSELPCIAVPAEDDRNKELSLAENIFRKNLSPMEEAAAIKDWLDIGRSGIPFIAEAMKRTPDWVKSRLDLLDWPDELQAAIHQGIISVSSARNLAQITDDAYRGSLVIMAIENGATARTTAAWFQAWQAARPLAEAATVEPVPGRPVTAPVVPFSPCTCCETQIQSDKMPFMPICMDCLGDVKELGRQLRLARQASS